MRVSTEIPEHITSLLFSLSPFFWLVHGEGLSGDLSWPKGKLTSFSSLRNTLFSVVLILLLEQVLWICLPCFNGSLGSTWVTFPSREKSARQSCWSLLVFTFLIEWWGQVLSNGFLRDHHYGPFLGYSPWIMLLLWLPPLESEPSNITYLALQVPFLMKEQGACHDRE